MEIRFAEKEDLPQIVELCKQHAEYERVEYDKKGKERLLFEAVFGASPSLKCLVVATENSIVGYATCMKQFSTWDANFYMYLDCLFLTEETRGKGFGTALIERIKEYAKTEKCTVIQWQTPDFNKKAIRFYQKNGGISKAKKRFFMKVLNKANS